MKRQSWWPAMLSALALLFAAGHASAQTVSCEGVPQWSSSTIYKAGDRMQYQGRLYEATISIWNAAPDYCPTCGWYRLIGTCGGTGNVPPTANAGADFAVNEGAAANLRGTGTDSDGTVVSYQWTQTAGTAVTLTNANSANASFSAPQVSADTALTFQLVVTDNQGATGSDAVVVTVRNVTTGNQSPTANAGADRTVAEGTNVSLNGSGTDADGSVAAYQWAQTAGPSVTLSGATTANASFTAPQVTADTALTFRLTVTDNLGATGSDTVVITVRDGTVGSTKQVGSYFTQWGIYGRNYHVKNIDTSGAAAKLTFINYAFGNVYTDGRCGIVNRAESGNGDGGDAWADFGRGYDAGLSVDGIGDTWDQKLKGNFNQLKKLKARHPHLKLFISLGGWTWSKNFSRFSATAAARQTMAASCIDLYLKGNLPLIDGTGGAGAAAGVFDGIDIDWEYPVAGGQPYNTVSPADKQNFTLLLQEFRRQLDQLETETGRQFLLTIAAGSGADKIDNTEPGQYSQHLDWINLMTYDYHGGWDAKGPTSFHSNLYLDPNNPFTGVAHTYSTEVAVQKLLAAGVPSQKIVLGIPFYGRGWTGVPNTNNGLYQSATGPAPGTYEPGIEDYKVLATRNAPKFYDPVTRQLWTYNGNEFWSFDDPTVIATKINYVNGNSLGGLFSWSLDGDDANATLTKETAKVRP